MIVFSPYMSFSFFCGTMLHILNRLYAIVASPCFNSFLNFDHESPTRFPVEAILCFHEFCACRDGCKRARYGSLISSCNYVPRYSVDGVLCIYGGG